MLIILAIYIILGNGHSTAHTVNCTNNQCQNSFINCPPRESCFISCTEPQSCSKSIINCPVSGDCSIECLGTESCQDVTIDATLLSGNFKLNCGDHSGTTSHCTNMKIYGNTLQSNHGSFFINCNGAHASCVHSEICCPVNGHCNILCNGDTSCQLSQITGLQNSDVNIHCNSPRSCYAAIFNGVQSSTLNITGCTEHKSCLDVSIYCPPYSNGHKNCFIEGNDNLGRDKATKMPTVSPSIAPTLPTDQPTMNTNEPTIPPSYNPTNMPILPPSVSPTEYPGEGMKIYAIHGWKDIDIKYSGTYSDTHDGMMRCGNNYHISCDIAKYNWTCGNDNSCSFNDNDVNVGSKDMSISPTILPSIAPIEYNEVNNHGIDIIDYMNNNMTTIEPINMNNNNTHTTVLYNNTKVNGDIFILSGVGLVIITCVCVGCAQIRKNIHDLRRETKNAVPSSTHTTTRSTPDDWKFSQSRSHISRSHISCSRGSRSQSHYNHPIEHNDK